MVPAVLIISFILDSIVSNFISLDSLFFPLFTLMALIIIYPYFNNNRQKYFGVCLVTGICYDLIYSNTIIIHGMLFLLIGFIITRLNLIISNNSINVGIMAIVCIVIYRFLAYGLLLITASTSFEWFSLLKSIYSSLILNIFYVILIYIITDKISRKFKIHRTN